MPLERRNVPDPIGVIRASPVLRALSPATADAVAAELQHAELAAGESLFPESDRIDALYIVRGGALRASEAGLHGVETLVRVIGPGEALDQLQVISGGARPVRVRADGPCALAVIPGDVVDALVAAHPDFRAVRERVHRRQLFCRLYSIFGALDGSFLDDLEATADWTHLAHGQVLFEPNDPSDALYFVISGRVQTICTQRDGSAQVLGESGRGDTVGDNDFFADEPRTARVQAVRDSVLVGFTSAEFDALVARRPHVLRHVMRNIVERHRRPALATPSSGRVATVAVVPVSPGVQIAEFTDRLAAQLSAFGPVMRLTAHDVDARMAEPGIAQAPEGAVESERLLAWLEGQEGNHRFLVYETDPTATPWTRRCLRQADRILLVARASDDPRPGEVERALLLPEGRVTDAYEMLVLVHPDGSCLPSGTRRWLAERPHVEEHHHLRWREADDFARLARILAGRAVGVVLGGGGARGFAHIGVLKALREAGIPVDMIGGTSMGAALAAQWALGWTPEMIRDINRRVWIEIRPHKKLTIPVVSLVGNRLAEQCGRMMYGETDIEDLWIPFYCVSSNLTTAEMMVHRRGSLLRAATASASLPGFAVPLVEGRHLLVDGALLNNLPTDVMRQLGAGIVIASEVSVEEDASFLADRVPSPWEVLRGRVRFPSLMEVVLRASLLHSTHREALALHDADFSLRPPVERFSMMDFPRLAELIEVGYAYARGAIAAWREQQGGVSAGVLSSERNALPLHAAAAATP